MCQDACDHRTSRRPSLPLLRTFLDGIGTIIQLDKTGLRGRMLGLRNAQLRNARRNNLLKLHEGGMP